MVFDTLRDYSTTVCMQTLQSHIRWAIFNPTRPGLVLKEETPCVLWAQSFPTSETNQLLLISLHKLFYIPDKLQLTALKHHVKYTKRRMIQGVRNQLPGLIQLSTGFWPKS